MSRYVGAEVRLDLSVDNASRVVINFVLAFLHVETLHAGFIYPGAKTAASAGRIGKAYFSLSSRVLERHARFMHSPFNRSMVIEATAGLLLYSSIDTGRRVFVCCSVSIYLAVAVNVNPWHALPPAHASSRLLLDLTVCRWVYHGGSIAVSCWEGLLQ